MPTLQDHLADLADDAPRAPSSEPGLAVRARGYHRRRRAGTVVIAVTVIVALASLALVTRTLAQPTIDPAGSTTAPALPDEFVSPSPWLPGTDEAGPLGRLALVAAAERRGWPFRQDAVIGVSATTGEYRFLDLPDLDDESVFDGPTLSPDGLRLAYWMTGDTSGSPNRSSISGEPIVGFALYDTVTGETVRYPIDSEHGLSPTQLAWVDSQRLLVGFGRYEGGEGDPELAQMMAIEGAAQLWRFSASGSVTEAVENLDPEVVGDGWLVGLGPVTIVDADDLDRRRVVRVRRSAGGSGQVWVSPNGRRIAGVRGGGAQQSRIWAGDLPLGADTAEVRPPFVPQSQRTLSLLGWAGDRHVVARRTLPEDASYFGPTIFSIEVIQVRTGESRTLLVTGSDVTLATDLVTRDSVSRPAPPRPLDPRLTSGLGLSVLLAAGLALRRWRRRVRP